MSKPKIRFPEKAASSAEVMDYINQKNKRH